MRRVIHPEDFRQWMRWVERRMRQIDSRAGQTATGSLLGGATPTGSVTFYAAATAPQGWLICDGSAVSRTTYDGLFEVIGTTYGVGDGSTTFNLPDMRRRFPRGLIPGTDTVGTNEGQATPTSRTIAHTHGLASHTHNASGLSTSNFTMSDLQNTAVGGTAGRLIGAAPNLVHSHNVVGSTGAASPNVSDPTANADFPYLYLNAIIRI